ncbi:MAG: UvrD-helicase domain-containing protein, partial [Solirubrobacteraceae bacterium]
MSQENARGDSTDRLSLLADGAAADRSLDGLLPAQVDAATHSEARVVVLGAAGTGKTRVVQARFEWLVAEGCDPGRIGVLVPTGARAAALGARIETRLSRGYDELNVLAPAQLAGLVLRAAGAGADPFASVLTPGDRLAMLVERIDELSLRHHDFGGRPNTLLGGFVRRIDRLKAELVTAKAYVTWAQALPDDAPDAELEREFAQIYCTHERMLAEASARDDGDLIVSALDLARAQPNLARRFDYLLLDDAQELDLAPATLAMEVSARRGVTIAGDPDAGLRRYRGAGAARMRSFQHAERDGLRVIVLERSHRCPGRIWQAAASALGRDPS